MGWTTGVPFPAEESVLFSVWHRVQTSTGPT